VADPNEDNFRAAVRKAEVVHKEARKSQERRGERIWWSPGLFFSFFLFCLFHFFDCHLSNILLSLSIASIIEQVSYYCPAM
jgi:hypothetical protein